MLHFYIEKDGDQYHAYCKELKGCHTFGATPAKAMRNLKDAVNLYLEDLLECQLWKNLEDKQELCLN